MAKNSFIITETFRPGKNMFRYYRDTAKDAIEKVEFLYNDWCKVMKTPSGRRPPYLPKTKVEQLLNNLNKNQAASLSSPKSWDPWIVWTIHRV